MKTLRGSRTNYLWLDSGPFFQDTLRFFQDVLNKNASGLGPAIILGPDPGAFFSGDGSFFQDILNKNASVLGLAIISGPIRVRFFSGYAGVFFRIRQPANVILR